MQVVAGRLVVEVPAQLERAAPVVGTLVSRTAERLAPVTVVAVVRLVLLDDVPQAAGLMADVGEEGRGLTLADRVAAGGGEDRVGAERVGQTLVRVEGVPARVHLVELGLADHERARGGRGRRRGGQGQRARDGGRASRTNLIERTKDILDQNSTSGQTDFDTLLAPIRN